MTSNEHSAVLFETALGTCAVRWNEVGIREVLLPRRHGYAGERVELAGRLAAPVRAAIEEIVALLDGEPRDLRAFTLDERELDSFRRRVYAATRQIGCGTTASYGEIAATIGEPGLAREVGAALGRNPFPVIVPCHRVLSAEGGLHGFSAPGGIATKRRMLEIERAPGFVQQPLFA
jgi:methylated-DNA-[protein]-cysteine S-methyltransferase